MRIEAWDPERLEEGPLSTTAANERGAFRFAFDSAWLADHYADRPMMMRFKAYQDETLYADSTVEVAFAGGEMDLNIDVNFEKPFVPPPPPPAPEPPPPPPPPVVAQPQQINVVVERQPEPKLPQPPVALTAQLPHALAEHAQPELHILRAVGQLVDQASGHPLPGYTLRVISDEGAELAIDVTSREGLFVLVAGDRDAEHLAAAQRGRIHVRLTSPDGKEAGTIETAWPEHGHALSIALAASASRAVSPAIVDVGRIANLSLPHGLLRVFAENGVHTLADLLRIGGTQSLGRLPIGHDHPAIRAIEAHAVLSTLSSDLELNALLIDKGYLSALKIANTPRADFIAALGDKVGDVRAAQVHAAALAQVAVVDEVVLGLQAEAAVGAPSSLPNLTLPPSISDGAARADGRAAHLGDLLATAVQQLRRENGAVSIADLVEMLGQPLDQLLVRGDDETLVRESRIAVEVLRRYLGAKDSPAEYLDAVYRALLARSGASPTELRLALQSAEHRRDLAATLRIDNDEALLGALVLRTDLPDGHAQGLTEDQLERRFGLRSTTNRPLSDGAVYGDGQDQVRRYHLRGVAWARNTDEDGTIYVRLKRQSGAGARVSLFRDRSRTQLVAYGETHGASATVGLAEQHGSGLSGFLELQFTAESDTIELQPIPQLLAYRLAHAARPAAQSPGVVAGPIVDPDRIGPDDFRLPYPHNPVFELWRKRRQWVDRQLHELLNLPSLQAMAETMYKQGGAAYGSSYPDAPWQETTPLQAFEQLADDLLRPVRAAQVEARLRVDLGLSADEWQRLFSLLAVERVRKLDPSERAEAASLLLVSHKRAMAASWQEEEHALRVDLQPELFWPSLTEPSIGPWPPVLGAVRLDPDDGDSSRPDGVYGQRARTILEARRAEVRRRQRELRRLFEKEGLPGLAAEVFGSAAGHLDELVALAADASPEKAAERAEKAAAARAALQLDAEAADAWLSLGHADGKLHWETRAQVVFATDRRRNLESRWAEEENNLGLEYWHTHKATLPPWRATAEDRAAWRAALANATRASLIDPEAILLDELQQPLGGAAAELLAERRSFLAERRRDAERVRFQAGSGLAAFDSLVLGSLAALGKIAAQEGVRAECKGVRQQLGIEAAIELGLGLSSADLDAWKVRLGDATTRAATEDQIVNHLYLSVEQFERLLVLRGYTQSGSASAAAGEELDGMLSAALLLRATFRPGDENLSQRLAQLGLDSDDLATLQRLRSAAKHGPLGELEVLEIERVLLAGERVRLGWRWRKEEAERGVSVSPVWFRLGEDTEVPPSAAVGNPTLRHRFKETLAERTAEQARLIDDHHAMIDAVEEQLMASLYDGIVMRSTIPGGSLQRRREWVARNLRLPAQPSSEARTTRVEMAARCLWSLCQAAASGELHRDPLNLSVAPGSATSFAQVRSYDEWREHRAARLFPERALRFDASGPSAALVALREQLAAANDPAEVAGALSAFSETLHALSDIRVEAATLVTTGRAVAGQPRSQVLLLGRQPSVDRRFAATFDADLPARLALSPWQPLEHGGLPGEVLGVARRHGAPVLVSVTHGELWLLPFDPQAGTFQAVESLALPASYSSLALVEQQEGVALTARRSDGAFVELEVTGGQARQRRLLVPATLGQHYVAVAAHVGLGERGALLVLQSAGGELHYRWLGALDDGRLRPLAAGAFVGTAILGKGVEAWWRRHDLVFRRRLTPGALQVQTLAGLSAIAGWLLEATGLDLKSRYVTNGFGAGRPLLTLLTSELLSDEQRELVLGQLTAEVFSDSEGELAQVDQVVMRLAGRGLAPLLKGALEGATVDVPHRDDAVELQPPLAEQSGLVGAPALSGVTRRFEVTGADGSGWVVLERAGRSLLAARRLEGEREQLGEPLSLQLQTQPVLEVVGDLAVAPSVGRWDLGTDEPELLHAIGQTLAEAADSAPLVQAQAIEEAFLLAPLEAAQTLRRLAETQAADRIEAVALVEHFGKPAQGLPRLGDGHATPADWTLGRPGALGRALGLAKVERLITLARLSDGGERLRLFAEAGAALDKVAPRHGAAGARFLQLELDPPNEWAGTTHRLLRRLVALASRAAVDAIFEEVKAAVAADGGWDARLRKLADLVARGEALAEENQRIAALVEENTEAVATAHEVLLNEPAVAEAARRAAERAAAELGRTAAALLHQPLAHLRSEHEATPWLRAAGKAPSRSTVKTDGHVLAAEGLRRPTLSLAARLGGTPSRGLPPQSGVRLQRPAIFDALQAEIEAELAGSGSPLCESPAEWLSQTERELERLHDEALVARRHNGWRATLAELDSDWQRARRNRAAATRFSTWLHAAQEAADLESLEAVNRHFPPLDE